MDLRQRDQLYGYQKRAVDFIKSHPNCALWADMGLGKSAVTMTAVTDLINNFDARRCLVVAPLRVARKVFTDEARQWEHLNHLKFSKMVGHKRHRLHSLIQEGDFHLINRENVPWLVDTFFDQHGKQKRYWPYDTVVLDESQSFMSQSAQRWAAMRRVRKLFPRMIQLTGTPEPKKYNSLWAQMFLLDRGERLGRSEKAYRDRWFDREMGDGYCTYTLKKGAEKEIQQRISDIVLSLKVEDYFDLPPVVYNPVRVQLRLMDLSRYNKFERKSLTELPDGRKITAANAGVLSQKLLQMANGFLYTGDDHSKYEIFHNEKIHALQEVLESSKGPVMIAYNFTADRDRILAMLKKFCKSWQKYAVADSDADLEAFAKGLIDYLVLHPASAGHGLNDMHLSGSETIVWFGLTSNLEWYQQLNARLIGGIRRIGKNVQIHHILCDRTIDMRWFEVLKDKGACQEDLTRTLAWRATNLDQLHAGCWVRSYEQQFGLGHGQ